MDGASPTLRFARPADAADLDTLMKASIRDLFPAWYDERQTASSVVYVGHVDSMLIHDRTYFALEVESGDLVACGGWSRRDKLYTGSSDQEARVRALDPQTESARVRAMFVRSDSTRRGLGTRILEACEAAAKVEGSPTSRFWRRFRAGRSTSGSDSVRRGVSRSRCPTVSRWSTRRWRSRSRSLAMRP
jgi:GNAT superfamily N-acetyltransferase